MKIFLSKKSKKRIKRTFFLFMAILFFYHTSFSSLGAVGASPSGDDQVYISGEAEQEEAETVKESEEKNLAYDSQPEIIEEVREWIDRYVDSDFDGREKPNWEEEVDESLIPDGWKCDFVEGGDEYFDGDYYTIFLDYDPQPETIEEVQGWIDRYVDSDFDASEKPNWEKEVDESLMPEGWYCDFVEGGDEHFEADYYTIFQEEEIEIEEPIAEAEQESDEEVVESDEIEEPIVETEQDDSEEVAESEETEAEAFEFDPQPTTKEEVQEWIDAYKAANYDPSAKPRWRENVDKDLMPKDWKTDFIEDGDEYFGIDHYTIFPSVSAARANTITLPDGDGSAELQTAIGNANSGDTILISGDMTFLDTVNIPSGMEITIQSYDSEYPVTLTTTSGRHFTVDGSLVLEGIVLDGSANSTSENPSGGVHVNQNSNFTMNDGAVIQNSYAYGGGGVLVYNETYNISNAGNFYMNEGAVIQNCYALDGGGVAIFYSTFTMTGGTIDNNTASREEGGQGGGVNLSYHSTFTMSGGTISNNKAFPDGESTYTSWGGGVFTTGTFTMSGGTISNNTVNNGDGGGVFTTGTFAISGGSTISNNTANHGNGGGVFTAGRFNMIGGMISENKATFSGEDEDGWWPGNGGGVYLTISANRATRAAISISGGEIIDNTAYNNGGGVYTAFGITMTDVTISNNTAYNNGGGVYTIWDYEGVIMERVTICDNAAYNDGGGLYVNGNMATVTNSTIKDNTAVKNGGGIYLADSGQLSVLGDTSIIKNSAGIDGGGIYTEDTDEYKNLSTDVSTEFSDNTASALYMPPENAATLYSWIGFSSRSMPEIVDHPLNNYDINYTGSTILAYTVTFESNGGTAVPTQTVEVGEKARKPDDPTKDGYVFKGWYIDDVTFQDEWDFATVVTRSMTLYANWIDEADILRVSVSTSSFYVDAHTTDVQSLDSSNITNLSERDINVTFTGIGVGEDATANAEYPNNISTNDTHIITLVEDASDSVETNPLHLTFENIENFGGTSTIVEGVNLIPNTPYGSVNGFFGTLAGTSNTDYETAGIGTFKLGGQYTGEFYAEDIPVQVSLNFHFEFVETIVNIN